MTAELTVTGHIVVPDGLLQRGWLTVRDGRIAALGEGEPPAAPDAYDAGDALIFPGVVDGQTHATSYGGLPGIESTTRSAVAGGVTTLVDMPYDNPAPLSDMSRFVAKRAAIEDLAHCDMALYATIMPDQTLDEVDGLVAAGVVAFKLSSFESSPTRFPRIPADRILALMEKLAPTHLPIGLHNEDQEIVRAGIANSKALGRDGIAAHSESRPLAAEMAATAAFVEIGAAAGAHAHLVHLTTGSGFDVVADARRRGARATGELCVHYLWFDPDTDGSELGSLMKVNPPIRPGAIDDLWQVVRDDKVALVSSDHSSWPIDDKHTESIFDAGAGVPGVETLLPAFYTAADTAGFDAAQLTARLLAESPAKFFGLWPQKGAIQVGADADLAIFRRGEVRWDAGAAHDGLRWSPFDGRVFHGRVERTYVRGSLAWDGTLVANAPGDGQYVGRGNGGWFA